MGIMGIISSATALFLVTQSPSSASTFHAEPIVFTSHKISIKSIQTVADIGLPVRLSIPSLDINVALEYVGLTLQGEMDVPKGKDNAGWYNLGPRPGENGSAVIDGHYGVWKNGKVAVFNNLYKLRKGDVLNVRDENGTIIPFVVRESRIYQQDEDVPDVFKSNDGKSHLNLITCQGIWNKFKKSYPERLVIFTDRIEER